MFQILKDVLVGRRVEYVFSCSSDILVEQIRELFLTKLRQDSFNLYGRWLKRYSFFQVMPLRPAGMTTRGGRVWLTGVIQEETPVKTKLAITIKSGLGMRLLIAFLILFSVYNLGYFFSNHHYADDLPAGIISLAVAALLVWDMRARINVFSKEFEFFILEK